MRVGGQRRIQSVRTVTIRTGALLAHQGPHILTLRLREVRVSAARTPVGLSDDDVDALRAALADGRRPRVRLGASAGLPGGSTGQVVRLDDPARTREYVVVRVNGDDLPFAPSELELVRRGRPSKLSVPPAEPEPPRQGRKPRARELSVTLSYAGGGWTVRATSGTRALVKPTAVRPGAALRLVEALEQPAVSAAVAEIVEAARSEAADRAEHLRRALAAAEAEIADYHG